MLGAYTFMYGERYRVSRHTVPCHCYTKSTHIKHLDKSTNISRDMKEKEAKRAGRKAYLGIPRNRANPQIYGETGETRPVG
jgi:hypothetical protein